MAIAAALAFSKQVGDLEFSRKVSANVIGSVIEHPIHQVH